MLLEGKRFLVTGVLTKGSIAYSVAERAQQEGAEIVLTGFGRTRRMTERAAKKLPDPPDVLELDVNNPDDFAALAAELDSRWGALGRRAARHRLRSRRRPRRQLHERSGGVGRRWPFRPARTASRRSPSRLLPLLSSKEGGSGSLVGMDFDASVAWPVYDWMGVAKAALESVSRYLARDLGPSGVRVNLVSAGPVETPAAGGIPGFDALAGMWGEQAPLGWDTGDPAAVADTVLFLLSDLSRRITGEIVHVDGGYHAMGAPLSTGS